MGENKWDAHCLLSSFNLSHLTTHILINPSLSAHFNYLQKGKTHWLKYLMHFWGNVVWQNTLLKVYLLTSVPVFWELSSCWTLSDGTFRKSVAGAQLTLQFNISSTTMSFPTFLVQASFQRNSVSLNLSGGFIYIIVWRRKITWGLAFLFFLITLIIPRWWCTVWPLRRSLSLELIKTTTNSINWKS